MTSEDRTRWEPIIAGLLAWCVFIFMIVSAVAAMAIVSQLIRWTF